MDTTHSLGMYIAFAVAGFTGSILAIATHRPKNKSNLYARIACGAILATFCGNFTAKIFLLNGIKEDKLDLDVIMPFGVAYGIAGWYIVMVLQKIWSIVLSSNQPLTELARLFRFVKTSGESEESRINKKE